MLHNELRMAHEPLGTGYGMAGDESCAGESKERGLQEIVDPRVADFEDS